MHAAVLSALSIAGLAYLGGGAVLYCLQQRFLFHPTPRPPEVNAERLEFTSQGERIEFLRVNPGKQRAILYLGGNAEAVETLTERMPAVAPEHTTYLLYYRAFGGSTGVPREQALYADAAWLLERLLEEYPRVDIVGRSMGSGIATWLAAHPSYRDRVTRLVLITPFDSVRAVAERKFPIYPIARMLRDHFDSLSRAKEIMAPTLVLLATRDAVVPRRHTLRLVEGLTGAPVSLAEVAGSNHFNVLERPDFERFTAPFLVR